MTNLNSIQAGSRANGVALGRPELHRPVGLRRLERAIESGDLATARTVFARIQSGVQKGLPAEAAKAFEKLGGALDNGIEDAQKAWRDFSAAAKPAAQQGTQLGRPDPANVAGSRNGYRTGGPAPVPNEWGGTQLGKPDPTNVAGSRGEFALGRPDLAGTRASNGYLSKGESEFRTRFHPGLAAYNGNINAGEAMIEVSDKGPIVSYVDNSKEPRMTQGPLIDTAT